MRELLSRYLSGDCSKEEEGLIESWYNEMAAASDSFEINMATVKQSEGRMWKALQSATTSSVRGSTVIYFNRFVRRWAAAALIVFSLSISLYYMIPKLQDSFSRQTIERIEPGRQRASLSTSLGETYVLDEVKEGISVGSGGIVYNDERKTEVLSYSFLPIEELTLTTPRGGEYFIELSDGTRVWLNAESELVYPVEFNGGHREVRLKGEAYFEVSHDPDKAFYVVSDGQRIQVLGTKFNVCAYPDEDVTTSTLLEGRIRISHELGTKQSLVLEPGEQVVQNEQGLLVRQTDVRDVISWKEGRISFNGKSFDQVMRELGRWYDLDIRYEGEIPQNEFYGDAYRGANLSLVLGLLKSARLEYRLEGKTLVIVNKY